MSLSVLGFVIIGVGCSPLPPSTGGTICGEVSSEPLSGEVRELRRSAACTADSQEVERIKPKYSGNPGNVQNVELSLPAAAFEEIFPSRAPAYTYTNFLRAIGKYPAICASAKLCPKTLANMLAHFQQETAGLVYLEEINKSLYCADWADWIKSAYPCKPGKLYYGRGAKQLSWNYNYGAFSTAMFGDSQVLLDNPELVATSWLNFASAMWFFVTPQSPKPSMLEVIDGTWKPNSVDNAANLQPEFGATTMIMNGAIECGTAPPNPTAAANRARYYEDYAGKLGVNIAGENLLCSSLEPFSRNGSAGKAALFWGPAIGCGLVTWQTAYSALVEGDYARCKGEVSSSNAASTSLSTSSAISYESPQVTPLDTTVDSTLCVDPYGLYPYPSSCRSYYQCSLSVPYKKACPEHLLWNDLLKLCDWPENVDCSNNGQETEPASTNAVTTSKLTFVPALHIFLPSLTPHHVSLPTSRPHHVSLDVKNEHKVKGRFF